MTRHMITTRSLLHDIEEKRRADARLRWEQSFTGAARPDTGPTAIGPRIDENIADRDHR